MRRLVSLILLLLSVVPTFGWGKMGHNVVCYIAECNLDTTALRHVTDVLGGRSLVYYSSWMDSASNSREYAYTKEWHYFNMKRGDRVATAKRSKSGDLLSAMTDIVERLKSEELSREDEFVALKMLIHLVGDMHQPMHLGREDDEGGNTVPVVYFTQSTSLHAAWDYHLVKGVREWSYTEWQREIDRLTPEERMIVVGGTMEEWIDATHEITNQIYRDTPAETRMFYDYLDRYTPVIEQQLLYAGLRLAAILNDIY